MGGGGGNGYFKTCGIIRHKSTALHVNCLERFNPSVHIIPHLLEDCVNGDSWKNHSFPQRIGRREWSGPKYTSTRQWSDVFWNDKSMLYHHYQTIWIYFCRFRRHQTIVEVICTDVLNCSEINISSFPALYDVGCCRMCEGCCDRWEK